LLWPGATFSFNLLQAGYTAGTSVSVSGMSKCAEYITMGAENVEVCPVGSAVTKSCSCSISQTKAQKCSKGQYCTFGKGCGTTANAAAVTDINSESSYLPAVKDPEPSVPLITGQAAVSGYSGYVYTSASTKGQPVKLHTGAIWKYDYNDQAVANAILKHTEGNVFFVTDSTGHIIECSCKTYSDAATLKSKKSSSCTQRTSFCTAGADCSKYCKGTVSSKAPAATTTTSAKKASSAVKSVIPTGATECYEVSGNSLIIKTLGSSTAKTISVSGLIQKSVAATSTLKQATGTVMLTYSKPEQYGVRAYGLTSGDTVNVSNIKTGTTTIDMDVGVSPANGVSQFAVNIFHMKLVADEAKTTVNLAGVGSLSTCSTPVNAPCIVSIEVDRVSIALPQQSSRTIRIGGLQKSTNPCVGKSVGDSCGSGLTCRAPPVSGYTLLECMSECRYNWAYQKSSYLNDGTLAWLSESRFCVSSKSYCKGTVDESTSNLCPSGQYCCSDGSGKPPPKKSKSTSTKVSSGGTNPCADVDCAGLGVEGCDLTCCEVKTTTSGIMTIKACSDLPASALKNAGKTCAGSSGGVSYVGTCANSCSSGAVAVTDSKACGTLKCCACPSGSLGVMKPGTKCPAGCDAMCKSSCTGYTPPAKYDSKNKKCAIGDCPTNQVLYTGSGSTLKTLPCMCAGTKLYKAGSSCCVLDGKKTPIQGYNGYSDPCSQCQNNVKNCASYETGKTSDYWRKENCNDDFCGLPYKCTWTSGKCVSS
jgi:hypothetical protein